MSRRKDLRITHRSQKNMNNSKQAAVEEFVYFVETYFMDGLRGHDIILL